MRNGHKVFTVTIFHTPQPGFQYEAWIYLDDELMIRTGGMTEDEAEQAAREWIAKHYEPQPPSRTQVRSFTVQVDAALAMT